MVCEPWPTVNDCCVSGAAPKLASPAWSASITQLPAVVGKETTEPEMVQSEVLAPSTLNRTGLPDGPPVALRV